MTSFIQTCLLHFYHCPIPRPAIQYNHPLYTESYDQEDWYDLRPGKVCGIYQTGGGYRFIVHTTDPTEVPFHFNKSLESEFLASFKLGGTTRIIEVKLEDLVEPLIVFSNYGGNEKNRIHSIVAKEEVVELFQYIPQKQ